MKKELVIATTMFALAGCGGGGTSSGPDIAVKPAETNILERTVDENSGNSTDESSSLLDIVAGDAVDGETLSTQAPTTAAEIPTVTSATYAGGAIIGETSENTNFLEAGSVSYLAVGAVELEIDFQSLGVSGTATDFVEVIGRTPEGELFGGGIDGTIEISEDGSFEGSLTKLNGENAIYSLVGETQLLGENAEFLVGLAEGTSSATGRSDANAGMIIITEPN